MGDRYYCAVLLLSEPLKKLEAYTFLYVLNDLTSSRVGNSMEGEEPSAVNPFVVHIGKAICLGAFFELIHV